MTDYFFADLVRERSFASGAGPMVLEGALPGYRSFETTVPSGAHFYYAIAGVAHAQEWETGIGLLDGVGRLVRTPLSSPNDGAAVNFSGGLKTVTLTVAADWFTAMQEGGSGPEIADGALLALGTAIDTRDESAAPGDYPLGQSAYLTGTGFPFAGQVVTLRYPDGSGFQRNSGTTSGGARRVAVRYIDGTGWSAWDGVEYAPDLLNGWGPHASFTSNPLYMREVNGMVHLSGNIAGGTQDNNTVLFTLPAGFRSASQQYTRPRLSRDDQPLCGDEPLYAAGQ